MQWSPAVVAARPTPPGLAVQGAGGLALLALSPGAGGKGGGVAAGLSGEPARGLGAPGVLRWVPAAPSRALREGAGRGRGRGGGAERQTPAPGCQRLLRGCRFCCCGCCSLREEGNGGRLAGGNALSGGGRRGAGAGTGGGRAAEAARWMVRACGSTGGAGCFEPRQPGRRGSSGCRSLSRRSGLPLKGEGRTAPLRLSPQAPQRPPEASLLPRLWLALAALGAASPDFAYELCLGNGRSSLSGRQRGGRVCVLGRRGPRGRAPLLLSPRTRDFLGAGVFAEEPRTSPWTWKLFSGSQHFEARVLIQ